MVRNIKALKRGFVYAKSLYPETKQQNRQIKIGSKAYDRLLNTPSKSIKRNTVQYKRRTAYKKYLPKFEEGPNLSTLKPLIRNNFIFNDRQKNIILRILRKELNKTNTKRIVEFKIKGERKFSESKVIAFKGKYLRDLADMLSTGGSYDETITPGSDVMGDVYFRGITDFRIKNIARTGNMFKSKSGKFFPYTNTTNIDLKRYQVFTKDDVNEQKHCVLHTLETCGIDISLVSHIGTNFDTTESFAKKNFHRVADIINKSISLKTYDGKRFQKYTFGDNKNDVIKIALFNDHYFIDEETDISSYASLHYDEVKDLPNWNHIIRMKRNKYVRDSNKYKVDSITLLNNLLKTNHFINTVYNTNTITKETKIVDDVYGNIDNEQKIYEHTEYKNKRDITLYYADIETDMSSGKHIPLMIGIAGVRHLSCVERVQVLFNESSDPESDNLYVSFMDYIVKTTPKDTSAIVYMHNLKYDYNTFRQFIYRHQGSPLEKDGQLYSVKVRHKGHIVEFRDSYKLIPIALKDFNKSFNLPEKYNKKDAIAYNYYNLHNLKKTRIKVSEYEKYLPECKVEILHNNLSKEKDLFQYCKIGKEYYFDPIAYYEYYLQYDVYILYLGLESHRESVSTITDNKINVTDCLTVSTISDKYMKVNGAYDNVYSVSGNLRDFISKGIYGGRVQVNELYKKKVIDGKFANIDAKALYSSAIDRMCKEYGLPTGKCERITVYTKEELDEYKYYIVKVLITKINKKQQIAMVSYKDKNGSIQYTNKIKKPIEVVIDMITLEDWINYQKIEYKILDGFYWNSTYNKKMGELNAKIFNDRLKYKDEGKESLAGVAKLMGNSTYGKMIKKKIQHKYRIISDKDKDKTIETYWSLMESSKRLPNGETQIKLNSYDSSSNYAHIGVFVLSYSKRIMNEVFDIANTHNCPIYYTDTDSIHCNYDDLKIIENEFRNKYSRELIGENMGQFHSDFKLEGAVSEIYAIKSIFVGKKSYIDVLESKNEKGETIRGIHFRMKSIPPVSLQHHAKLHYNDDLVKLYEDLAKGISMDIVMNPENVKVMFEYKNNAINTRADGSFIRTIKF